MRRKAVVTLPCCVFRVGWEFTAQPAQLRHIAGVPPFRQAGDDAFTNRRILLAEAHMDDSLTETADYKSMLLLQDADVKNNCLQICRNYSNTFKLFFICSSLHLSPFDDSNVGSLISLFLCSSGFSVPWKKVSELLK